MKYESCQLVLSEEYGSGMQIFPEQCRLNVRCLYPPSSHGSLISGLWWETRHGNSPGSSHMSTLFSFSFTAICSTCLTGFLTCCLLIHLFSTNETLPFRLPPTTLRSLLRKACSWGLESWSLQLITFIKKKKKKNMQRERRRQKMCF